MTSDVHESVRTNTQVTDPSWQKWVDLVSLGVTESQHVIWVDGVRPAASRTPETPLLHGATLRIDPGRASRFIARLASEFGILDVDRIDSLSLILTGIERDAETIDLLADKLAASADTVAVFAQLAALPVLLNAAKLLDAETSRTWQRGYCPVCGAWPSLVEMRGIQRERRLRCGCCSSDWMLPVLRCAFCNEIDHNKLGFLLPEEGDQQVRVETCSMCRGYLKILFTLSTLPFPTLALKDASTVAFDLVARDRGYTRPSPSGWQVQVEIVQ